jgi:tetratricopeptide (TPR) repeat protein
MYLSGSKWNLTRRRGRRGSPWRILILLALIGGALYINQVVVPATPPLFIPTPTATRAPESFVNEADQLYNDGKLTQAIDVYRQAVATDPDNPSLYISMAKAQIYTSQYEAALESAERALILNNNNRSHMPSRPGRWISRVITLRRRRQSNGLWSWIRTMPSLTPSTLRF